MLDMHGPMSATNLFRECGSCYEKMTDKRSICPWLALTTSSGITPPYKPLAASFGKSGLIKVLDCMGYSGLFALIDIFVVV